eukprot:TRINITY_DN452_c0_g2_i2.p1 TRINITY_DN452_c0_g2~~TRINITY_DN452_c0_g2_i2.p1  ORF type:complete len:2815 (+),score=996.50 TRINITY_DN452_c0_g2_i2:92-8446(+)
MSRTGSPLHGEFFRLAAAEPGRTALIVPTSGSDAKHVTRGALAAAADSLAARLVAAGCGGRPVAVCFEQDDLAVAAVLGCLRAGAPWVPLVPGVAERAAFCLSDSGAAVVLCDAATAPALRATAPVADGRAALVLVDADVFEAKPASAVEPTAGPCYMMYTSGSTGQPRAVLGSHAASVARLRWALTDLPFDATDVCILKTSAVFVDSVAEVFTPLSAGVPLVVAPRAARADPEQLLELCRRFAVTRLVLVPTLLRAVLRLCPRPLSEHVPALRCWVLSGEPLPAGLAREFFGADPSPGTQLLNLYGATECAADVCYARYGSAAALPTGDVSVPIGVPMPGCGIHLVDPATSAEPVAGQPGEMYVTGAHLAEGYVGSQSGGFGYLHRSGGRFVFTETPRDGAERCWRSGDFAIQGSGGLQFVGRRDQQCKIGGRRVDLVEVEATLGMDPSVAAVAVTRRDDSIVAHLQLADDVTEPTPELAVRSRALQRLPDWMLPSRFVLVQQLPKLPSGKLDRAKLAAMAAPTTVAVGATPLAAAWAEILDRDAADIAKCREEGTSFFAVGGDSLKALKLTQLIRERLRRHVTVAEVAAAGSLPAMEAVCEAAESVSPTARRAVPEPTEGPLSAIQAGILYHHTTSPGAYLQQFVLSADRVVEPSALVSAWRGVVDAHAALRTSFEASGDVQRVAAVGTVAVEVAALRWAEADGAELADFLAADRKRGMDVGRAPLLRCAVARCGGASTVVLTVHHLITDGTSVNVLLAALTEPRPAASLLSYIDWERSQPVAEAAAYWKGLLDGAAAVPRLVDGAADGSTADGVATAVRVPVPADIASGVRRAAATHGVTLSALVNTVWSQLYAAALRTDEVVYGVTSAGRAGAAGHFADVDGIVGPLVKTLPLRIRAAGDQPVSAAAADVQQQLFSSVQHESLPLPDVLAFWGPQRQFDVIFNFEPEVEDVSLPGDARATLHSLHDSTGYAMTVRIIFAADGTLRSLVVTSETPALSAASLRVVAESLLAGLRTAADPRATTAAVAAHAPKFAAVKVPLTPVQQWFVGQDLARPEHFNQCLLLRARDRVDPARLRAAIDEVARRHPQLRARFALADKTQCVVAAPIPLTVDSGSSVAAAVRQLYASLNVTEGPVAAVGLIGDVVAVAAHHLVMDGVSQRIVAEDLGRAYRGLGLVEEAASFGDWAQHLAAQQPDAAAWPAEQPLRLTPEQRSRMVERAVERRRVTFDADETRRVLAARAAPAELLIAALALAIRGPDGGDVVLDMESHGRQPFSDAVDVSRTVGWFTAIHPLRLSLTDAHGACDSAAAALRALPEQRSLYGLLRTREAGCPPVATSKFLFNYLGVMDEAGDAPWQYHFDEEVDADWTAADNLRSHPVVVEGFVSGGLLRFAVEYCSGFEDAAGLAERWQQSVRWLLSVEEAAAEHWRTVTERAADAAPELPTPLAPPGAPRPVTETVLLSAPEWAALEGRCGGRPSTVAATLFGETLRRWSAKPQIAFAVNAAGPLPVRLGAAGGSVDECVSEVAAELGRHAAYSGRWDPASAGWEQSASFSSALPDGLALRRRPKLIAIHYAGGSASVFSQWARRLADTFDVVPVEIAGHGTRRAEQPAVRVADVVDDVMRSTALHITREPYCLFGYSFGALVAHQLAVQLAALGAPPLHLFVASQAPPAETVPAANPDVDDAALIEQLQQTGLVSAAVVEAGADAWGALLAPFRADLTVEKEHAAGVAAGRSVGCVPCPVTAFEADADATLPRVGTMRGWMQATTAAFEHRLVSGGHMFIDDSAESLTAMLACMQQLRPDGGPVAECGGAGFHGTVSLAVSEEEGALRCDFNIDASAFPSEVVLGLPKTFCTLLTRLAESAEAWRQPSWALLPDAMQSKQYRPQSALSPDLLHEGFCRRAAAAPEAAALLHGEELEQVSYGQLEEATRRLAQRIGERVERSEGEVVVAVLLEKGWRQVVSVLACLRAHAAYLPLDPNLPQQRQQAVVAASGTALVMCDRTSLEKAEWLTEAAELLFDVDAELELGRADEPVRTVRERPEARSLAYLIYTSGSTGVPKGVRCHHEGAVNTIDDLNSQFDIGVGDRVLALSSMSFDLSVYDVFGMLRVGATMVVPPASSISPPDPAVWLDMLHSSKTTIWNTVPRFMELLVSHAEQVGGRLPACLRLVWMSGDFIPVSLPGRIRALADNADMRVISMGGATEAAVWSNIFEIPMQRPTPDDSWSTVPYGQPMRNQTMYILDENMNHCEPWVTGRIWIGGAGTELGYHRDEERTKKQFVHHPRTGEWMFKPGDLGRLRPDGLLEILGREDSQVKVNGFRVELGEIERVIEGDDSVQASVATVQSKRIVAFVVLREGYSLDEAELRSRCSAALPEYMVPAAVRALDALPLNRNGKADPSKLPKIELAGGQRCEGAELPRDELEQTARRLFAAALRMDPDELCVSRSFFASGGDSLAALLLLRRLNEELPGASLRVADLFSNPSVAGLCDVVRQRTQEDSQQHQLQLVKLRDGRGLQPRPPIVLVHAAGASGLAYRELCDAGLDTRRAVYAVDDAALSGATFSLQSIDAAAQRVADLVAGLGEDEVVLGGWSYGGVVALAAAELLAGSVERVLLFDAARISAGGAEVRPRISEPPFARADPAAEAHFEACTRLLEAHSSALDARCPVHSFRPGMTTAEAEEADAPLAAAASGVWTSCGAAGCHWTVISAANAAGLAADVNDVLGGASTCGSRDSVEYEGQKSPSTQSGSATSGTIPADDSRSTSPAEVLPKVIAGVKQAPVLV